MTNEEIAAKIAELEQKRKMIEANANLEIGKCLGQIECYCTLLMPRIQVSESSITTTEEKSKDGA